VAEFESITPHLLLPEIEPSNKVFEKSNPLPVINWVTEPVLSAIIIELFGIKIYGAPW
jgi:hypothetical protein